MLLANTLFRGVMIVAVLTIAQISNAASVTYQFNGEITSGDLVGSQLVGQFTIDQPPGPGNILYKPVGNDTPGILLSMNIEVGGTSFAMSDEIEFPFRPLVVFSDGEVTALIAFLDTQDASLDIFYDLFTGADGFVYRNFVDGIDYFGVIQSFEKIVVPLPAGGLLLLSAFFAFFGIKKRNEPC